MKLSHFLILTVSVILLSIPTVSSAKTVAKPSFAAKAKTSSPAAKNNNIFKKKNGKNNVNNNETPGLWPCMDALDKRLIMISIPMIINFSITPLVGANDLFWTNRMGNALIVAGQAAATQVYNSGFWLASFLPSVTSTLVSKENAKGNQEGVQDAVCQALLVGLLIAAIGTPFFFLRPEKALGTVLEAGAPAMEFAKLYLGIRAFSFLPGLTTLVGFSAFRGMSFEY